MMAVLPKNKGRLFSDWIIKLNDFDQLVVEGTLECNRRALTKPIAERITATMVSSKCQHIYHLKGNIADTNYEIPGFVRQRFHAGFPQDWESIVEVWKSSVARDRKSSSMFKDSPITNGPRFAVKDYKEDYSLKEYKCRKVSEAATDEQLADNSHVAEGIENIKKNIEKKFDEIHEPLNDQKSGNIIIAKQLVHWTPFVVPSGTLQYHLGFTGTLLSSMGHAICKNHKTGSLYKRHNARLIETVNREFYELIGDINNSKHNVPKELVLWCRNGCPRKIKLFCEKWTIIKKAEITFLKLSPRGKKRIREKQGSSFITFQEESYSSVATDQHNSLLLMQPVQKNTKRHRAETSTEKVGGTLISNSPACKQPKSRVSSHPGMISSENKNTAKGENLEIIKEDSPRSTLVNKQWPLLSNQTPHMSVPVTCPKNFTLHPF